MRDDNTYTRDGEDLDLVTLETERYRDRETQRQGDMEAVTENSKGNQQQQHSDHHRRGKKSTELKTNWLRSKQSRYRSKYSWAEILRVTLHHNGALYGHILAGGVCSTLVCQCLETYTKTSTINLCWQKRWKMVMFSLKENKWHYRCRAK